MDYKIDKNGKKITYSYFGDLDGKLNFAKSYIQMFNSMASDNHSPQIDVQVALKKIQKSHQRFYNEDNKYLGNGSLRK